MLLLKTRVCFNEPDYVKVHSIIKIMTGNGAKIAHKMPQ